MIGPEAHAVSIQIPWACAAPRCRRRWSEFWRIPASAPIAGLRPARCPFCGSARTTSGPFAILERKFDKAVPT